MHDGTISSTLHCRDTEYLRFQTPSFYWQEYLKNHETVVFQQSGSLFNTVLDNTGTVFQPPAFHSGP